MSTGFADDDIVHLTTPDAWAAAQGSGRLEPDGFAVEGFVHCSTGAQLDDTIARHFARVDELVLLRLHPGAIGADLRWEESRPGSVYPHVYRALVLADVADAVPWRPT